MSRVGPGHLDPIRMVYPSSDATRERPWLNAARHGCHTALYHTRYPPTHTQNHIMWYDMTPTSGGDAMQCDASTRYSDTPTGYNAIPTRSLARSNATPAWP